MGNVAKITGVDQRASIIQEETLSTKTILLLSFVGMLTFYAVRLGYTYFEHHAIFNFFSPPPVSNWVGFSYSFLRDTVETFFITSIFSLFLLSWRIDKGGINYLIIAALAAVVALVSGTFDHGIIAIINGLPKALKSMMPASYASSLYFLKCASFLCLFGLLYFSLKLLHAKSYLKGKVRGAWSLGQSRFLLICAFALFIGLIAGGGLILSEPSFALLSILERLMPLADDEGGVGTVLVLHLRMVLAVLMVIALSLLVPYLLLPTKLKQLSFSQAPPAAKSVIAMLIAFLASTLPPIAVGYSLFAMQIPVIPEVLVFIVFITIVIDCFQLFNRKWLIIGYLALLILVQLICRIYLTQLHGGSFTAQFVSAETTDTATYITFVCAVIFPALFWAVCGSLQLGLHALYAIGCKDYDDSQYSFYRSYFARLFMPLTRWLFK